MVIFFDLENNHTINQYIKSNIEIIKQRFIEEGRNFIYIPNIDYSQINRELLNFYVPYLDTTNFGFLLIEQTHKGKIQEFFGDKTENIYKDDYQNVLGFIGYKGTKKCGFIFFDDPEYYDYNAATNTSIIEFDDTNIEVFFNNLFAFFNSEKNRIEQVDYMISNHGRFNPYENIDEGALAKINEIQKQLYELKHNGQLLFVLPVLKKLLEKETSTIDIDSENNLLIDENFRIILPNFNNIEIQLSHLTKAIYVLFYNNPQGINIKQIYVYKKEIISLYAGISNQLDYDKMLQSIDDLIKPDNKAIYTHISRIKSAFYKQMDYKFADKFIVTSTSFGNDLKFIPILKNKIDPEKEFHPNVTFDL